jgi:hypothetical protein
MNVCFLSSSVWCVEHIKRYPLYDTAVLNQFRIQNDYGPCLGVAQGG